MLVAVIPAWNEADSIGSVLEGVKKYVDEVVVIDDGSSDQTTAIARAAGVHTIVHPINRGQGAALQTGHDYARRLGADYVVHFDADGQFEPKEIPLALKSLQSAQADILLGSRYLNKKTELPFSKRYILHPLSRLVNFLFGTPNMSDAHNGFRILTKKALDTIEIQQDRMAHATEIPAQVKEHGLKYIEFPVTVRYFEYGQNIKGGFRILKELIFGQFIRQPMIFQVLIFLFSLVAIFSIFLRRQKDGLGIRSTAFWILFWIGVDIVVLFPNSTTILANKLGIGRGTDLVVYLSILTIFFLLFRLNVKIEGTNRQITKIVRQKAIDEALKK